MVKVRRRVHLLRLLADARNEAFALGFDATAADIRLLLYQIIRMWDDEIQSEEE